MTVVAIMLVKDEIDIIEHTISHMAGQVDKIRVYDNESMDGTREILYDLQENYSELHVYRDYEPGYYQSRKMTRWAREAFEAGDQWVIPCDADEYWYVPGETSLRDYLLGVPPDVQLVSADLYNHLPTRLDEGTEPNPYLRLGWRQRMKAPLPKVAVRTRPDLTIHAGNHGASYSGTGLRIPGLVVRHYSWRSEDQYLCKIRNGYEAYAATNLPEDIGTHWRMWGPDVPDETIREHFRTWFYSEHPEADESLMYDPAPYVGTT